MGRRALHTEVAIILLLIALCLMVNADPSGPQITVSGVENGSVRPAAMLNTSGGTIATVNLNATTQNPHWKAYVGNVTGKLILEDAANYSVYEWTVSHVAGEVYVTRNNSVHWSSITCANLSNIAAEETAMNHTSIADDNIRNTFSRTQHKEFWAGSTDFTQNQCNYSLITFVNDTAQTGTAKFQEILLWDTSSLIYTSILENRTLGFDLNSYDFQLIVPEKGWDGPVSSTPYYFYVELI